MTFGTNSMRVAEAEFAFRMAHSLEARDIPYSLGEVLEAVDSLHSAIEIPDSRFEDFRTVGAAELIADDACAHLFVLGPDLECHVLLIERKSTAHTGDIILQKTRSIAEQLKSQ